MLLLLSEKRHLAEKKVCRSFGTDKSKVHPKNLLIPAAHQRAPERLCAALAMDSANLAADDVVVPLASILPLSEQPTEQSVWAMVASR